MKSPILLFDPNPVAARRLAMQLRHAGFATYVTFDGAAAVSSARGRQFASIVVIADLADSQMRRCLHELRGADSEACLIVISDPAVEGDRDLVRELGGNAMLDVPFTILDLSQRLSMISPRVQPVV
jgi:DNA-binding response OmpR family regulator